MTDYTELCKCSERWSDEIGCSDDAPSTEHECKRTGKHYTHICHCHAMVVDAELAALITAFNAGMSRHDS